MSAQVISTMSKETANVEQEIEVTSQQRLIPGLILTLFIIALLAAIGTKLADPSTIPVRHVSVTGDFVHLSPISLQERASEVVRGGFFNVNVETIQDTLLQEPWIDEVSVKRIWPDRITVNIREQIAIAKWGDAGLINSNAHVFYPDKATIPEKLPTITGPENSAVLILEHLIIVQNNLPVSLDVDELSLSERRSWRLTLNNGLIIRLGKENMISRIDQFFKYYHLNFINRLEHIQYVDMRYTNGFVIRWFPETNTELNNGQDNNG